MRFAGQHPFRNIQVVRSSFASEHWCPFFFHPYTRIPTAVVVIIVVVGVHCFSVVIVHLWRRRSSCSPKLQTETRHSDGRSRGKSIGGKQKQKFKNKPSTFRLSDSQRVSSGSSKPGPVRLPLGLCVPDRPGRLLLFGVLHNSSKTFLLFFTDQPVPNSSRSCFRSVVSFGRGSSVSDFTPLNVFSGKI